MGFLFGEVSLVLVQNKLGLEHLIIISNWAFLKYCLIFKL